MFAAKDQVTVQNGVQQSRQKRQFAPWWQRQQFPQRQPPQPQQQFPQQFVQPQPQPSVSSQQCVTLDETVGRDNGPDNALWYFREDIQLNAHHFVWHLIFPTSSGQPISRRGELFYMVHHDLLARYSTERLANGLTPVEPAPLFLDWNSVLAEGYNPHLTDAISSQFWAPRPANVQLNANTLNRDVGTRLQNLATYRQRIVDLLTTGSVNVNGRFVPLSNADNINILGDMFEASVFSINPTYYGQPGLHNDGHFVIASILGNFPAGSLGVMAHSATAMRDMIFYRIHKGVDNLFSAYKNTFLPPYVLSTGDYPLIFDGVRINSVAVQSAAAQSSPNRLGTFWNRRQFNLQGGLDFNPNNVNGAPTISVCAKHLDHEEFTYQIQVDNNRNRVTNGFVRIFMAPRYKSLASQERYTFNEQRGLFFTMDSFIQPLQPGANMITRRSIDSTLTVPWQSSVQQLRQDVINGRTGAVNCECGFPHHLLLPKGTEEGMAFDLFVMITNADTDFVQGTSQSQFGQCIPSHIHCGILGQPYPDAKPLGYPFDRRPFITQVQTQDANGNPVVTNIPPSNLESYVAAVPNMGTSQVIITHRNIQIVQ
ncbi:Phenoloxidase subunit 1 [Folsomia candida]|uniref:Phenoloxidase subunit 1 n=1 Tax=Folsomia candida TaxID=158441 RepID=A0A226EQM0_FOLCA|nr:Phenoloxidase subunit 1 [Folsomia candida]